MATVKKRFHFFVTLFVLLHTVAIVAQLTVEEGTVRRAELVTPSDPEYAIQRDAIMQSAGPEHPLIAKLQPVSVLLRNKYDRAIVAYGIRWALRQSSGETFSFSKIYWDESALRVRQPVVPNELYAGHVVPVAESRLITPFFNLSTHSKVARSGLDDLVGPQDLANQMMNAKEIKVTLDSVIYADGLCEGDDQLFLCERVDGEVDGIRSVVSHALKLRSNGVASSRIVQEIQSVVGVQPRNPPLPGASREEWAAFSKGRLLKQLLRNQQRYGDDAAIAAMLGMYSSFRVFRDGAPAGDIESQH